MNSREKLDKLSLECHKLISEKLGYNLITEEERLEIYHRIFKKPS
jgi:hypothetical protein